MPYGHYIFTKYHRRDAMLRVFSPIGCIVISIPFHLVLNQDFKDYLIYRFSPVCNTSAKSLAMKAPFNNNLPTQTNDVKVNPRNPEYPDSNIQLPHA